MVKRAKDAQQKSYTWHAHDALEVMSLLGVGKEGLTEQVVKERRRKHGLNKFTEIKPPGLIAHIYGQLKSPLALVLLLAFGATVFLHEYIDAGVILLALLVAVVVGVLQEGKASNAFATLSKSQVHMAVVIRNGQKHELRTEELVPGDLVELESGVGVPADLRLISTKQLSVNESALTGEWRSVEKTSQALSVGTPRLERGNMVFMGSYVAEGYGQGVVVETGDRTMMGSLAQSVQTIEDEKTPLQLQMQQLARIMLYIIAGLVITVFAIGVVNDHSVHDMLLVSIAVAVASVPEGLPAAVTIVLAISMESLLRRGGLVRNLLAAETLGSTTYILTDKTGTLTHGKMSLSGLVIDTTVNLKPSTWNKGSVAHELMDISLAATNAFSEEVRGRIVTRGDSVEQAILERALAVGIDPDKDSGRAERIDYLAFVPERRFAAGLVPGHSNNRLCVNGAPEELLAHADSVRTTNGIKKLTAEERENITDLLLKFASEGKRILAVGYLDVDYDSLPEKIEAKKLLKGLVFGGLLILSDPVRVDVKEAITGAKTAGTDILLITGDNPETALSVAKAVGIAEATGTALTGVDLEELSDDELFAVLENVKVFARVLPEQKMRIAQILQIHGEIVAMTGDGINDALALRKANIGVAVGSGTEVAKESADLVLVNDSFKIIYAAIEEGRRIISNLRKITGYLLSTSLTEVVLISGALVTGGAVPILPTQILWANVIEEGLMSVAFAFEKGEKEAMKRPPRDVHEEGILSRDMLWFIAMVVTILSLLILSLYFYLRILGVPLEELRSVMFVAIAVDSLFMAFSFRSLTSPIWKTSFKDNMFFVGSFLISLVMLIVALSVPFMQYVLSYTPLPLFDLGLVFLFGLLSLVTIEIGKWLFFRE